MRKTLYYLVSIIIAGGTLVSFWVYQKYFKPETTDFLMFIVERGDVQEIIKARGEVVAEKDFDLEFPFPGTMEKIFVKEGQLVKAGNSLVKLETIDLELEAARLKAKLNQSQENLNKLIAGVTKEELQVFATKVVNAKIAINEAKKNLIDKLQDAYTKSDDAIRNKVDQFISNSRSSDPQLGFTIVDPQLEIDIELKRIVIESILESWKSLLLGLIPAIDLTPYAETTKSNLSLVKLFLDSVALAVNGVTSNANISQATLDGWRIDVAAARTNLNTANTNIVAAEEKLTNAQSNLSLAEDELALKSAATRMEDIEIAKSQIEEIKNQIAIIDEKIRKSILYAPSEAKITKIWLEKGEFAGPGKIIVSLSTFGHKIQAEISELDIGKVRDANGNDVLIKFDAFPDLELRGRVVFIEPKEIIKEGDKFYRTNIYVEPHNDYQIRSGMSADLVIRISFKENILKIPELAINERNGKKFVTILEENKQKEAEIETGISDGESIEVIKGLNVGQIVVVSVD